MTTHNTHHEDSDVDTSVVEYSPAPESTVDPTISQTAQTKEDSQETGDNSSEPVSLAMDAQEELQEAPTSSAGVVDAAPEISENKESSTPPEFEGWSIQEEVTDPLKDTNEPETIAAPVVVADEVQQPVEEKSEEESTRQETSEVQIEVPDAQVEVSGVQAEVSNVVVEESTVVDPVAQVQKQDSDVVFTYVEVAPLVDEKAEDVRPFTDFIEEFRQAEAARKQAKINDAQIEQFAILSTNKIENDLESSVGQSENASSAHLENSAKAPVEGINADEQPKLISEQGETETAENEVKVEEATPEVVRPAVTERAVSPLLRPASRLRIPRHSMRHQREEPAIVEPVAQVVEPEVAPVEESIIPAEVETPAKPARRYRFDRPANKTVTPLSVTPTAKRSEAIRAITAKQAVVEVRAEVIQTASENTTPASNVSATGRAVEPQVEEVTVAESAPVAQATPAVSENGRRRHGHKEQHVATPVTPVANVQVPSPVAEVAAINVEVTPKAEVVAPEDLPPLEYAELQKASSRRRRRHRSSASANVAPAPVPSVPPVVPVVPEIGITAGVPKIPGVLATPNAAGMPAIPGVSRVPAINNLPPEVPELPDLSTQNGGNGAAGYTIVSGYTVNQMNQGNDLVGPFMGPEPSPARGSVFTRDGRNTRAEVQVQRTSSPSYPARGSESGLNAASMTQFANIVSQAIQTQTDRMVTELRRTNQAPTNVSVSLPPFPSTERVGVFVDVANLLYSARTLRMAVDFGKLLDFLRGNRRLVRAHAYCPTSPQVTEEQMFLQAVKGLGYRITTKNYKTFSSGAKKADLDLDLCMDVVRLVDGGAVDCIVLVSGDSDFMPMLDYCSDHGVRVEVAAFDEAMSATLRQSCDLFVNLSMLEEIRA